MNHINGFLCVLVVVAASGCARLQSVGQVPQFTSPVRGNEVFAMTAQPMAATRAHPRPTRGVVALDVRPPVPARRSPARASGGIS